MEASTQFVAFYPDALLYLTKQGDVEAVGVLVALAKHANQFGGCDPGDKALSDLAGHRRDRIPCILQRLQGIDYVHIIETHVAYRQQPLRGFQISPYVLRLRPECHSSAVADWQHFNPQTKPGYEKQTKVINFPVNDQQPESDPEPASKPDPELAPQPAIRTKTSASGAVQTDPVNRVGQKQKPGQPQRAAQPDLHVAGDESTLFRPREPRSLARYAGMLAEAEAERLAVNLKAIAADLSLPNARMLVDVYGIGAVNATMQEFWARGDAPIISPARWVRKVIRRLYEPEEVEA